MYYIYVLIIPTTLVCLLFSTAIPTSLFNFKQLFFILVSKQEKLLINTLVPTLYSQNAWMYIGISKFPCGRMSPDL